MRNSRTLLSATAFVVILIALMASASGQSVPRSSPPSPQAPPQQALPGELAPRQSEAPAAASREGSSGLLDEMGKLFEKSLSILPKVKSPSEALDDLNERAKEAGENLSNLARPSSVVTGRMACTVAGNGAPDCNAGADRLCQSKGFKQGKSLDTDATEKCSAKVYLPGYKREPGDCRTENYVTRALCQ